MYYLHAWNHERTDLKKKKNTDFRISGHSLLETGKLDIHEPHRREWRECSPSNDLQISLKHFFPGSFFFLKLSIWLFVGTFSLSRKTKEPCLNQKEMINGVHGGGGREDEVREGCTECWVTRRVSWGVGQQRCDNTEELGSLKAPCVSWNDFPWSHPSNGRSRG